MKFYRIWLSASIMDIAYEGTKEQVIKEFEEMYPGTFSGRVEEIIYKHFEIINTEARHVEWERG